MSTELTIHHEQPTSLSNPRWTPEDEQALRQTIGKDCDNAQFRVFLAAARRLGLDPFARQIVPIVQSNRMTPQTTIDGFRLIAERTNKYAGQYGPYWCGEDGEWKEVWTAKTDPIACRVGVIRRDFAQPLYDVAHMRSYRKETPTWKQLPIEMLAKVAEARALRRAFPQELSGVYTEDEMTVDAAPVVDVTPRTDATQATDPWGEVRELAAHLGLSDKERTDLFAKHKKNRDKILAELRQHYANETDQDGVTFETEDNSNNGHSLEGLPVHSA